MLYQQLDTASLLIFQSNPPKNTPGMYLAGFIEEKLKYTLAASQCKTQEQ